MGLQGLVEMRCYFVSLLRKNPKKLDLLSVSLIFQKWGVCSQKSHVLVHAFLDTKVGPAELFQQVSPKIPSRLLHWPLHIPTPGHTLLQLLPARDQALAALLPKTGLPVRN